MFMLDKCPTMSWHKSTPRKRPPTGAARKWSKGVPKNLLLRLFFGNNLARQKRTSKQRTPTLVDLQPTFPCATPKPQETALACINVLVTTSPTTAPDPLPPTSPPCQLLPISPFFTLSIFSGFSGIPNGASRGYFYACFEGCFGRVFQTKSQKIKIILRQKIIFKRFLGVEDCRESANRALVIVL